MVINKTKILTHVEKSIEKLEKKFYNNHDYFMDMKELDLTAYLYHLIAEKHSFLDEVEVKYEDDDQNYGTKILQTESSTYDKVIKRKGRFDLTVYDFKKLANAKCETEQSYLVAIELKWLGSLNGKRGRNNTKDIKKEIKKINNDKNQVEHGFLLIFDKDERFTKAFKQAIINSNSNPRKLKIHFINSKIL